MAPAHDVTYCSGSSVEVFSILSGGVRFWKHHSGGVELDLLYILVLSTLATTYIA